jgi:hypothetical protein
LECGQPKTHQIQSHGGEPRGLSIISTSKKQRKFFGIHHRISALDTISSSLTGLCFFSLRSCASKYFVPRRVSRFGDSALDTISSSLTGLCFFYFDPVLPVRGPEAGDSDGNRTFLLPSTIELSW